MNSDVEQSVAGLSLSEVEPGRRVRVEAIRAGRALNARLAAMGLLAGVEVKVIRRSLTGPLVLAIRDTRLMLGRGVARRIQVDAGPLADSASAGSGRNSGTPPTVPSGKTP
ncbi:MAG: hypothetical protein A3K19_10080 [Lentisphaerae bacterium RIFOXYB12_FULL_65_16]|nr:MAG: hypothetical protein A3K18_27760 [Lentisphaerae bacterium RIFOXYA12_64_32]OGV91295.1 MAG: hypothetical protein A3K19_10080 [Lentisphaerae bacterium RIFOXYB12_FULL_65_16]